MAVGMAIAEFRPNAFQRRQSIPKGYPHAFQIVRMHEIVKPGTDQLFRCKTQDHSVRRGKITEKAVLIGFADQIEHIVGNAMQQVFALPQGGFGASALGNVPDDTEDTRNFSFNVQRRYLDDDFTPAAVVTDDAGFVAMDRKFVMQKTGIVMTIDMSNGRQEQFAIGFIDDFRKVQTEQFFKSGVATLIGTIEIFEKYRIRR
jgi:hypothetical protein